MQRSSFCPPGEKGVGRDSKKPLHFKNSTFHRTLREGASVGVGGCVWVWVWVWVWVLVLVWVWLWVRVWLWFECFVRLRAKAFG